MVVTTSIKSLNLCRTDVSETSWKRYRTVNDWVTRTPTKPS
jgi:hypothetical protein